MTGPTVRDADLIYFICGGCYAQEVIRLFNDVVTMNRWTGHCGFPVLISWTKKFACWEASLCLVDTLLLSFVLKTVGRQVDFFPLS